RARSGPPSQDTGLGSNLTFGHFHLSLLNRFVHTNVGDDPQWPFIAINIDVVRREKIITRRRQNSFTNDGCGPEIETGIVKDEVGIDVEETISSVDLRVDRADTTNVHDCNITGVVVATAITV